MSPHKLLISLVPHMDGEGVMSYSRAFSLFTIYSMYTTIYNNLFTIVHHSTGVSPTVVSLAL